MICDNCVCKNKCTKIISEGEKYCRDKMIEDTLFRINKGYPEAFYVRYDKGYRVVSENFLKEYSVTWR